MPGHGSRASCNGKPSKPTSWRLKAVRACANSQVNILAQARVQIRGRYAGESSQPPSIRVGEPLQAPPVRRSFYRRHLPRVRWWSQAVIREPFLRTPLGIASHVAKCVQVERPVIFAPNPAPRSSETFWRTLSIRLETISESATVFPGAQSRAAPRSSNFKLVRLGANGR